MPKKLILILLCFVMINISSAQTPDRPLVLPMQSEASPSTWLLGQPYGNTRGAYRNADRWYSAGQGLHFGLDFVAPCGTPVVAVADGIVRFVDDFGFGSRPHNVIIQHPQLGFSSLYGHLLNTSPIAAGTQVTQGQVIGASGDPDETCVSRPHLHYELRTLDYRTAINPVPHTDTNWSTLASIGSFGYPMFEQDLNNARLWLNLDDQPDVVFGGIRLNNFNQSYSAAVPQLYYASAPPPRSLPILQADTTWSLKQLGYDSCCQRYWWSKTDTDKFYVVDGGVNQLAGIYEWSISAAAPTNNIASLPLPITSPDGTHEASFFEGRAVFKRITDDTLIPTPVMNQIPAISPNNIHLMWIERDEITDPENPPTNIFVSNLDGTASRMIYSDISTSAMWLDDNRLLLTKRKDRTFMLSVLHIIDGTFSTLGTWENLRGLSISPGGTRLMFYLVSQPETSLNGMYTMETQANATLQKLNWFGGYQWRDADSVYYIPFDINSDVHQLAYYHFPTGANHMLTSPETQPFSIMNGDWSVSPDGNHILFHNAFYRNLWVLSLDG